MSITTAGDNLIHYEALGRGKPLVFLHSWLGSWRYWWPSMQALSTNCRTFAPDLLGFGDSSKATDQYSLSHYAQMLEVFIDRLGIVDPVVIVGHGLGAAVGVRYALRNPDAVSRLALVALPMSGEALNQRLLQGDYQTAVNRVTGRASSYPELEAEARKADPLAIATLSDEIGLTDFSAELAGIKCPLLIIHGEQDPLIQRPNGHQAIVREARPDRAYVNLQSCMHFPMLEETAKFNRLILEFLHAGDDVSALSPKEYWKRRTY